MKQCVFREYDIRGIIGKEFEIEETYRLAQAIATFLHQKHPECKRFIIGRDGRTHSIAIQQQMVNAIVDMGFDVIDVGLCPTPAVYFASRHLSIPSALMITASHNPKEYNGVKIDRVWGKQLQQICNIYEEKSFYSPRFKEKGVVNFYPIIEDYIDYLSNNFSHLKGLPIRAVIDCGNGAAGSVLPGLIEKMKWPNVKLLFAEVDGTFPNHEADPTVLENMRWVAQAFKDDSKLEMGLGLDGDCDRMNPMTRKGHLVPGDKMLALFAQRTLKDHPGATVICDIKSSKGVIDTLEEWGAKVQIAPSGHSLIKNAMAEHDALIAGELSCHFFFGDRYFGYDDGIYAILRTIELVHESSKPLEDLLKIMPQKATSPEFRIACAVEADKTKIVNRVKEVFAARKDVQLITIDGVRAQMDYGWGLLRASNTQSVISLRFESDTVEGLNQVKDDFFRLLTPYFDEKFLKEQIDL